MAATIPLSAGARVPAAVVVLVPPHDSPSDPRVVLWCSCHNGHACPRHKLVWASACCGRLRRGLPVTPVPQAAVAPRLLLLLLELHEAAASNAAHVVAAKGARRVPAVALADAAPHFGGTRRDRGNRRSGCLTAPSDSVRVVRRDAGARRLTLEA